MFVAKNTTTSKTKAKTRLSKQDVTSATAKLRSKFGAKPAAKKPVRRGDQPRMLKKPKYKSFRLHQKIKTPHPPVKSSFKIFNQTTRLLLTRKRLFLGLVLTFLLLSLVFVKGFAANLQISEIKTAINQVYGGLSGNVAGTAALFGLLVSSSGVSNLSDGASVYQSVLILGFVLSLIWSLRHLGESKLRIRDGYYNGMYPVVKFILVFCLLGLQMLPLAIGSWIHSIVISGGIVATAPEVFSAWILVGLLFLASMYMISSTIFALIIVTLPGLEPRKSLRSAKELVAHRRGVVIRKLLFLPLILLVIAAVIMLPFLLWLPKVAEWAFFVLTGFGWLIGVTYIYNLYRELLNEQTP